MISVVIIGGGNVAYHLINVFLNTKKITIKQIYNRDIQKIKHFKNKTSITSNIESLVNADIYIIAVSDDAISTVSSKILNKNALIVHTSGSVAMQNLKTIGRKGVFYPLQSFSKHKPVDFKDVPFCLEAEQQTDLDLLKQLATSISPKVYDINSEQRRQLHVAAVFVNNFVNHMYKIGYDLCKDYNVPFDVLVPLIRETSKKVVSLTPDEAQTGPAKRNDVKTIKNHLDLLTEKQQEIYNLITKSIQNG